MHLCLVHCLVFSIFKLADPKLGRRFKKKKISPCWAEGRGPWLHRVIYERKLEIRFTMCDHRPRVAQEMRRRWMPRTILSRCLVHNPSTNSFSWKRTIVTPSWQAPVSNIVLTLFSGKPLPQEMPSQRVSCYPQETTTLQMRFDPLQYVLSRVPMIRRWLAQVSECRPQWLLLQLRKLVPSLRGLLIPLSSFIHYPSKTGKCKCVVFEFVICLQHQVLCCNRCRCNCWAKVDQYLGSRRWSGALVVRIHSPHPRTLSSPAPLPLQNVQRPIKTPAVQLLKAQHYLQPDYILNYDLF